MKKLFGLLTALILAVVMIFPMGVFADAGGNTSNANGIPASATVYYGDVDWESNDLPDEFYVVKTEKFGNGMARIYREELRISYTLFKHYTGTKEISNEKYHTYTYHFTIYKSNVLLWRNIFLSKRYILRSLNIQSR